MSHDAIIRAHEIGLALVQGDMEKVNTWVKQRDLEALVQSISIAGEISTHIPIFCP